MKVEALLKGMGPKRKECHDSGDSTQVASTFPYEVLERVLVLVKSPKDRSSVSLVCKDWYEAERWSRTHVFIGNCYSVSPEIVARRFRNIRSVTLKGKPRFSDFNLVPPNWGANIRAWLVVFGAKYRCLEELRLKRMTVSDESLEFLALSFPNFKALSLVSCDGFSTDGLAAIATHCKMRNLSTIEVYQVIILSGSAKSIHRICPLKMAVCSGIHSSPVTSGYGRLLTLLWRSARQVLPHEGCNLLILEPDSVPSVVAPNSM